MTSHRPFALLPLLGMGLTACGASSGSGDDTRVAFVEVTSVPSGLPVEIRLNNTTFQATTPVTQNAQYDAICGILRTPTDSECALIGSADVKLADPTGKSLTLCLTDGGRRQCGSSKPNEGFVVVAFNF